MGKRAAKAKAGDVAQPDAAADNTNATHHNQMLQLVEQIADHPLMQMIRTAPPIERGVVDKLSGQTGHKTTFEAPGMASDLRAAGIAEAAGNFFWQNPFCPPLAGVPVSAAGIQILVDRNFR